MSECVWSLYRSSDACHVTSDPWRSVSDTTKVRGRLSFLNTETRAHWSSFLLCLEFSLLLSFFPHLQHAASPALTLKSIFRKCVFTELSLSFFHPALSFYVSITSTGSHPSTRLQRQMCIRFIVRKSRCSSGNVFRSSSTRLLSVSNESQPQHSHIQVTFLS